jgi:hypothetical protein
MKMKQIKLPIGFQFSLINRETNEMVGVPQAFKGYDWRAWPSIPDGIEYQVEDENLPQRFDYTVGPACKVVRWDPARWAVDEECWMGTAWEIVEVA